MRRIALTVAGVILPLLACAVPASAQATRTWVSGVGDDANPCSRTAPCKTFAGAISKTAVGGEINCLDPGGFGAVTITKSITISCEAGTAGVLVSGTNGIIVNDSASGTPNTAVVVLKGLDFEGLGTGLNAIRFTNGAALHVEDCSFRNFRGATPNGFGIQMAAAAAATFTVTRSTFVNNGVSTTGGGIQVRPTGGATTGTISNVTMNRNVNGIAADSGGGGSAVNVSILGSSINGSSSNGVVAAAAGNGAGVMVMNSTVNNNSVGFLASGAGAIVRVGGSSVTGNGTAFSGVQALSYLNNQVNGNGGGEGPGSAGGLH